MYYTHQDNNMYGGGNMDDGSGEMLDYDGQNAGHNSDYGPPNKRLKNNDMDGGRDRMDRFLERQDDKLPPNNIILITVANARYPITAEVIFKVCSIVGKVNKIVVFERNVVIQAMVEFESLDVASKARSSLHGCDIYTNCCTMKAEFSKLTELKVKTNGRMSWDFSKGAEEDSGQVQGKRRSILTPPDAPGGGGGMMGGMMGAPAMGGGMGGMPPGMGARKMAGGGGSGMLGDMMGGGGGGGGGFEPGLMAAGGFPGMEGPGMGSCVMLVYGLNSSQWNCQHLFNLLCQYGNVNQIFFMTNKPNTAMIEMGTHEAVINVRRNLNEIKVFGDSVRFDISKKHMRISNMPAEYELADGTASRRSYFNERDMNRFNSPDQARKNRIIRPSKVLHFFGISKIPDEEMMELFKDASAPQPTQIKWVPAREGAKLTGVGLLYFDSQDQATDALVLVSYAKVDGKHLKMCYSPAKF